MGYSRSPSSCPGPRSLASSGFLLALSWGCRKAVNPSRTLLWVTWPQEEREGSASCLRVRKKKNRNSEDTEDLATRCVSSSRRDHQHPDPLQPAKRVRKRTLLPPPPPQGWVLMPSWASLVRCDSSCFKRVVLCVISTCCFPLQYHPKLLILPHRHFKYICLALQATIPHPSPLLPHLTIIESHSPGSNLGLPLTSYISLGK